MILRKQKIGITFYGNPSSNAQNGVSGLVLFQEFYAQMLTDNGFDVVKYYFKWKKGVKAHLERIDNSSYYFVFDPVHRPFYLHKEALEYNLPYPIEVDQLSELMVATFRREYLDALHVIDWMGTGMVLWEAVLRWGGATVFTPTEHGTVCHYAFLLHPCGVSCSGPEDGRKCGRCTHGLDVSSLEFPLGHTWYSPRHRLFHAIAFMLPPPLRRRVLWALCHHFQFPGKAISENIGQARLTSVKRFLDTIDIVAYQSPHQYRLFKKCLNVDLPLKIPPVIVRHRHLTYELEMDFRSQTISDMPICFVYAARANYDRGIHFLLEAWSKWRPSSSLVKLVLFTNNPGRWLAKKVIQLQKLGLNIEVTHGGLSSEALIELHRNVHYVVNPAVWEEPLSATVLEGLFLGTPAVVPSSTGSADFITHGKNGFVFNFRNLDSFIGTLQEAVARRNEWDLLHQGALHASGMYDNTVKNHLEAICQFVSQKSKSETAPLYQYE